MSFPVVRSFNRFLELRHFRLGKLTVKVQRSSVCTPLLQVSKSPKPESTRTEVDGRSVSVSMNEHKRRKSERQASTTHASMQEDKGNQGTRSNNIVGSHSSFDHVQSVENASNDDSVVMGDSAATRLAADAGWGISCQSESKRVTSLGPGEFPECSADGVHGNASGKSVASTITVSDEENNRNAMLDEPASSFVVNTGDPNSSEKSENYAEVGARNVTLKSVAYVKVDVPLLRFVYGKGGETKKKIEQETNTTLCIPLSHEAKAGSSVVVEGPSQAAVNASVALIQEVLDKAVRSPSLQYSHFISLPLAVYPALVEHVKRFQESVLAWVDTDSESSISNTGVSGEKNADHMENHVVEVNKGKEELYVRNSLAADMEAGEATKAPEKGRKDPDTVEGVGNESDDEAVRTSNSKNAEQGFKNRLGLDRSIFIKPATIHLTVLMLKLWNEERVTAAAAVLQKTLPKLHEALENRPIAVRLRGLDCMRGIPSKAHVLYAQVEEADGGNRLARACEVIIDEFVEAGLVLEKDFKAPLKLHATFMNTSHRRMKKGKWRKPTPFDARQILDTYGSQDWGEFTLLGAHLSQRFVYGQNGYYQCCGSIEFPAFT